MFVAWFCVVAVTGWMLSRSQELTLNYQKLPIQTNGRMTNTVKTARIASIQKLVENFQNSQTYQNQLPDKSKPFDCVFKISVNIANMYN